MHFTRMRLNPARRGTRFLLSSPQRIHAAVLQGFPTLDEDDRVLWRVDRPSSHELTLYVVSPEQPDLTHVIEQAGWPTIPEATWQTTDYDPFLERLEAGQRWLFRVRVNPVRRRRDEQRRMRTFPHLTVAQQEQWLLDRAEAIGVSFEPPADGSSSLRLTERTSLTFERRSAAPGRGREVTIASAQIDGLLTVVDADKLGLALSKGIGRAKAYGCGLMTLASPS